MSTVSKVSGALIASWFNGSMGGQALAEVLTGKISPSGKLPMTWPKHLDDVPAYATGTYPQNIQGNNQGDIFVDITRNRSNDRNQQLIANYAEESLVGYRWYDSKQVPVAYPFGFGLSYATFLYSDLKVQPTAEGFNVQFVLSNNSSVDAEEVAQVYVSRPSSHIERAIKELKGFQRVALKAGERKTVTIPVRRADLCHWDESAQTWMLEPGDMTFLVGYTYSHPITKNKTGVYYSQQLTDTTSKDYTYMTTASDPSKGILKYRIQHNAKLNIGFMFWQKLGFEASLTYYSAMKNVDNIFYEMDCLNPDNSQANINFWSNMGTLPFTGYANFAKAHEKGSFTLDLSLSYKILPQLEVSFAIKNVLNNEYTLRPMYLEAPRNYVLKVVYGL